MLTLLLAVMLAVSRRGVWESSFRGQKLISRERKRGGIRNDLVQSEKIERWSEREIPLT